MHKISGTVLALGILAAALPMNAAVLEVYETRYAYKPQEISKFTETDQFVIGRPLQVKVKLTKNIKNTNTAPNSILKLAVLSGVKKYIGEKTKPHAFQRRILAVVHYPLNAYLLTKKDKEHLMKKLKNYKGILYVRGFTDCSGSKKYNDILAEKRAEEVSNFLRKHGFRVVVLKSIGKCCTLETADESRRVEISNKP